MALIELNDICFNYQKQELEPDLFIKLLFSDVKKTNFSYVFDKIKEVPVVVYGNLEQYNEVLSRGRCRIFYKYTTRLQTSSLAIIL